MCDISYKIALARLPPCGPRSTMDYQIYVIRTIILKIWWTWVHGRWTILRLFAIVLCDGVPHMELPSWCLTASSALGSWIRQFWVRMLKLNPLSQRIGCSMLVDCRS